MDRDTVELTELVGALRKGWLWLVGGTVAGVVGALLALMLVRAEYEGTSSLLLRNSSGGGGGALAGLGALAEMLPIGGIGGMLSSNVDTELGVLSSRLIIGEVVDSLGLQGWVKSPERLGITDVVSDAAYPRRMERAVYRFERQGEAYAVRGKGFAATVGPGETVALGEARVRLRPEGLPEEFELELLDREDAIDRVLDKLEIENESGEYVQIIYRGRDAEMAAAVPNLIVALYQEDREVNDRGVNRTRFEFLSRQADSILVELASAEGALRAHQEMTGMLDPMLNAEVGLERVMSVRGSLETVQVERRALQTILQQSIESGVTSRELAGYPTLLENGAINELLAQLFELETERAELLLRRTERDDEVIALNEAIASLDGQLAQLATDYLRGLREQETELERELGAYMSELGLFPQQAEESLRRQREVRRLTETLIVMQAQLVQTRLAAIGETGEVRQVDTAVPPLRVAFPKVPIFLVIGLFAGGLLGAFGALGSAYLSGRVKESYQAQLATGAPALLFQPHAPLLLRETASRRTVLILPVGRGANAAVVAHRAAATAAQQGKDVVLAQLGGNGGKPSTNRLLRPAAAIPSDAAVELESREYPVVVPGPGSDFERLGPGPAIHKLEEEYGLVIVALGGLEDPAAPALLTEGRPVILVGQTGLLERAELRDTAAMLEQLGLLVSGVVLHNGHLPDARGA